MVIHRNSLFKTKKCITKVVLVFSQSGQCGTQNSLCGTEWVPECCPGLQCSSDNGKVLALYS